MSHSKAGKRVLVLLLAMILVVGTVGVSVIARADSAAPVTVRVVNNNQKGTDDTDPKWPFDTVKAMEQKLGITLELKSETDDQDQLLIASGDIGDIMYIDKTKYLKQLIEGGLIQPLDDLVAQYAPDLAAQTTKLDFARQYLSDGTGKLYGLTCFSGSDGNGMYPQLGFFSRWDYYKELGYPELKNTDDVLNVLSQMVKAHPTTADGKTVYGMGVFTDWGMWPFTVNPMPAALGVTGIFSQTLALLPDGSYQVPSTDINSAFWQNLRFFNKANQMGIFDKDSLTQKSDEYDNKCANGQYVDICASWWMNKFNQSQLTADPKSTVGFEMLPMEGMQVYANNQQPIGATGWLFVMGSKCKDPVAAIKLLNYLNSYDGIRQLMCGDTDATIEMVDGKPEMKQDVIAKLAANDPTAPTIWKNSNMFGYTQNTINPADGQPLNLALTDRGFAAQCLPVDTDYATHYGAIYPYGVVKSFIEQGKMKDDGFMDYTVLSAMDAAPDDITRLDNAQTDILTNVCAQAILAADDAAFQAVFDKCVSDLKGAGVDQSVAFWTQNYEKAKAAVAAMGK